MVHIYVLELTNNKYYVGKTKNPIYRMTDHFTDGGSAWTKKYPPISIRELRPDRPDIDEQIVTQEYMNKFGIDNVRGGPWCKIFLDSSEKRIIDGIIKSGTDVCYKCGEKGHFSNKCVTRKPPHNNAFPFRVPTIRKKIAACKRCGRKNHNHYSCYAKTHIRGYSLGRRGDDDDAWGCSYCDKQFTSFRGAGYHERFYCKKNRGSTY
jgi:hypothetical protein